MTILNKFMILLSVILLLLCVLEPLRRKNGAQGNRMALPSRTSAMLPFQGPLEESDLDEDTRSPRRSA